MRRAPIPVHATVRTLAALAVAAALAAALAAGCAGPGTDAGPFVGAGATVTAVNISFEPVEISLPAGVPLRIVLDNRDSGVPHSVKVVQGDQAFGASPVVTGPALTEVRFGPLAPARYQFMCTVHPNMIGTLIVGS